MEKEEVVVPETAEVVVPETTETEVEEVIDWEAKAKKAEELANNYKTRAEKAEKAEKKAKETSVTTESKPDLSSRDIIALTKANVSEDDMDEVIEYSKFKKIPVSEALKSGIVKNLLKEKEEQRKTALATNTGTARRSSTKLSDEEIVDKAMRGEFPEDPAVLARAQANLKRKKQ